MALGATAVQIVWSSRRGSRSIEHMGSAHDDAELETLKAAARQRLAAGQAELDLGLGGPGTSGPLEIASWRMGHLLDALCRAYDALGFPQATGHDDVFRQLVLARIIEPTSKQDCLRVLKEAGAAAPSYPTLTEPGQHIRAGIDGPLPHRGERPRPRDHRGDADGEQPGHRMTAAASLPRVRDLGKEIENVVAAGSRNGRR